MPDYQSEHAMKGSLKAREGNFVYQLRFPVTTVGREGSDIILQSPNVEREHAVIEYDDSQGCFVVQDLNSAHGTYVNECRVQNAAVRLAAGDVIRFGFGNAGFEFLMDPVQPAHYSSQAPPRPWDSYRLRVVSTSTGTTLPYINTTMPTTGDSTLVYQTNQPLALPTATLGAGDSRSPEKKSGVLPHPPLRSRPVSAGTRNRPSSAGRERPPTISTGGWVSGPSTAGPPGQLSAPELEERLLRMGDELSRLASYEAECHRKDGVIAALRDEMTDMKSAISEQQGFRGGQDSSAFSSSSIIMELRQQITQLQNILTEKEEMGRASAQKLASYQQQLHTKNEEVTSLKDELHTKSKHTGWVKADPNSTTNAIASLRTELADKDRRIAQLNNTAEKLNKQKMQSTTLMNSLQRENSAKDALIHQAKNEIEKLRKQLREKEVTISSMSTKLTRQRAAKEVEQEAARKDKDLVALKGRLQTAEKQLKEKNKIVAEQQQELEKLENQLGQGRWSDRSLEQELDHAKAQWLDAQRNEKLTKVDLQQLEKRFDRFRRKVIQYTFSTGPSFPDRELDDDEIADHLKQLAHEKVSLVDEIKHYAEAENEKEERAAELKDAQVDLRKQLYSMEKRLAKSGRSCQALEEELTILDEMTVQDSVAWLKDLMTKLLSSELRWQKKTEEAMRRIGDDSDTESSFSVEDICKQLKTAKNECRKLKGKLSEMEETHQETIIRLRQDLKRDEERSVDRAVAAVRAEEEEARQRMVQEFRHQERERIQTAVDAERRVLESQHGSVTQLQQILSEKQRAFENQKQSLAVVKAECTEAKEKLQRSKETETQLRRQLQEQAVTSQAQVARLEREKSELKNYKEEDVASFKEQTRQHALTIVAMEERLLKLAKENKRMEQELTFNRQNSVRNNRSASPVKEKSRPTSPRKEPPRPQSPKKDAKPQTRSVETETVPQTSVEAAMQSDIYKLEQLVLLLRREASQAKKDAQSQADVVQALRRDLAGASARMSDMAGELSDKQKQKLEDYEERIRDQDNELEDQRKQLGKLSALVDEQQREINEREGILNEQHRALAKQKKDATRKGHELVAYKQQLACQLDEQQEQMEVIEKEAKTSTELTSLGARCRGERHDHVIARQREALADMRQKTKTLEQLKPPLPSHEQALQQIVALKKEVSELRAQLANIEEDYHKSETELHSELRVRREEAAVKTTESDFEKSSHRHTKEALDLSEKSYLKLARTLAGILEIEALPGCRSMAHLPEEERDRLEADRNKAVDVLREKVSQLFERLERKERLLGGYEHDLANLRETETVAGMKTAEASGLKLDVRNRTEEIAYLRETLSRHREELDQQRRLNVCLKERKKFAMDMEERELGSHSHAHNCYMDEQTRYKEEVKRKKAAEKARRKNYEIASLKKELRTADRELNETAAKLQALENSRSLTSAYSEDFEDEGQVEYDE